MNVRKRKKRGKKTMQKCMEKNKKSELGEENVVEKEQE